MAVTVGEFDADDQLGRGNLVWLGVFRPLIGAIFGLAVFFALEGGLINLSPETDAFYFTAFAAFLGGFTERLAPNVFRMNGGAQL